MITIINVIKASLIFVIILFSCKNANDLSSDLVGNEFKINASSLSQKITKENAILYYLFPRLISDSLTFIFSEDSIFYFENKKAIKAEKIKLSKNQLILNDIEYKLIRVNENIVLLSNDTSDTIFLNKVN